MSKCSNGMIPVKRTVQPYVTNGNVIGLTYKDGILLCADTVASYGRMCRFENVERFRDLGNKTVVAASGEYSDFQALVDNLNEECLHDFNEKDACDFGPKAYASYVSRLMYGKRCELDPYYNAVIIAGLESNAADFSVNNTKYLTKEHITISGEKNNLSQINTNVEGGIPVLYYCDMYGTFFRESLVATGLGKYFAMTLMRERHNPNMSEKDAKKLLQDCMVQMFYRDTGAYSKVQFSKVTKHGVVIELPFELPVSWNHYAFTKPTSQMPLAGSSW